MEAFGTLYDCIARAYYDESPTHLQERCLMHFLRINFPFAKQIMTTSDVIANQERLQWTNDSLRHPVMEHFFKKARQMSPTMPALEDVAYRPSKYLKLMKCIILRYVIYHRHHLERMYCIKTMGQLLSDLVGRPIAFFWRTPQKMKEDQPDCVIYPSEDLRYNSMETAILICCEQEVQSGQSVFVLVRSNKQSYTPREDLLSLRFCGEEEERSFVFEEEETMSSPYALWYYEKSDTQGHITNKIAPLSIVNGKHCLVVHPEAGRLYFVYPNDDNQTLLLPFAPGKALHVLANDKEVAIMASHDIYVYFDLDEFQGHPVNISVEVL